MPLRCLGTRDSLGTRAKHEGARGLGEGIELGGVPEGVTLGSWSDTEQLRLQGRPGICACGPRACRRRRRRCLLPIRAGTGPVRLRQVRDPPSSLSPGPLGSCQPSTPNQPQAPMKGWAARRRAFLSWGRAELTRPWFQPTPDKPLRPGLNVFPVSHPAPTRSGLLAMLWFGAVTS